jgi:hypothetical protein
VLHIGVPVLGEQETALEHQHGAGVLRPVEKHGLLDAGVRYREGKVRLVAPVEPKRFWCSLL